MMPRSMRKAIVFKEKTGGKKQARQAGRLKALIFRGGGHCLASCLRPGNLTEPAEETRQKAKHQSEGGGGSFSSNYCMKIFFFDN